MPSSSFSLSRKGREISAFVRVSRVEAQAGMSRLKGRVRYSAQLSRKGANASSCRGELSHAPADPTPTPSTCAGRCLVYTDSPSGLTPNS